jgi:hypothetical protein
MPEKDDSIPFIEIDPEPSDPNAPSKSNRTVPHATADWMAGFDEGRMRGGAEVFEALEASLVAVGVAPDVAKMIVARVRSRSEKSNK